MIEEVGGKAVVTRVGHSLIKEQMIKENAVFKSLPIEKVKCSGCFTGMLFK